MVTSMDPEGLVEILRGEVSRIVSELDRRDDVRELIFSISRELTRCSGRAVTYMNALDYARAFEELSRCREHVEKILGISRGDMDLVRYGAPLQAMVEFCEAVYLYIAVAGGDRDMARLCMEEIPPEARLLAIGDLCGEIRRHVINLVAMKRVGDAIPYVRLIEEIYSMVKYLDYPDSLVPGFRHKLDVIRRTIEDLERLVAEARINTELMERVEELLRRAGDLGFKRPRGD